MKRQLVAVAGWLGCKPRSLKRYQSIYEELGCDVIVRIPPPSVVVHSAMMFSKIDKTNKTINIPAPPQTMMDLALETINEICDKQENNLINYDEIYLHVFSNGGCFFWEAIYDIIMNNSNDNTLEDIRKISIIKSKLKGVIYDSAPANYYITNDDSTENGISLLMDALKYCSPSEQEYLQQHISSSMKNDQNQVSYRTRALDYWMKMKTFDNVNKDMRSLYIYSKTDRLTPFEDLQDLVRYRKEMFGDDLVHRLIYEDSPHCSHLLTDGKVYHDAIQKFLSSEDKCMGKNTSQRKLISRL